MKAKGAALRAEFERAKMAEATVAAEGGTSFDSVKDKITSRSAAAEARAELDAADGQSQAANATAMIETAAAEAKAAAKLAEIRGQMGLMGAGPQDGAVDSADAGATDSSDADTGDTDDGADNPS